MRFPVYWDDADRNTAGKVWTAITELRFGHIDTDFADQIMGQLEDAHGCEQLLHILNVIEEECQRTIADLEEQPEVYGEVSWLRKHIDRLKRHPSAGV